MTQEEFIEVLDSKRYPYEIEGNKIVVTYKGCVDLRSLTSIPPNVEFRNGMLVRLSSITSLPPNVEFRNGMSVNLASLTSIPPGVEFENGGGVDLGSLIGGYFDDWKGNIKGIDSKRLLNLMIKQGVFI
jgi:hypothetical protein